jgi:hypothetical protein
VPVDRKLLYIGPRPAGGRSRQTPPQMAAPAKQPPDVVDNLIAALSSARTATIREDIEAIVERNRTIGEFAS